MKDGFKNVNLNYTNRSSCVFPIFISPINDVNIIFLNYWKIKNNMKNIICNIRLHNEEGALINIFTFNIIKESYDISIKSILKETTNFTGIAIIEFISTENFGFTFPAVTAFYSSKSNYSGVHTAGRIKNTEENKIPGEIIETNWKCKWEKGITPFFTLFNGSIKSESRYIKINIINTKNQIIASKDIQLKIVEPYANKFFFLDEIFDLDKLELENNSFIEVKLPFSDYFPRMICGNFFREEQFLEVTHSFENQRENLDYLEEVKEKDSYYRVPSINPIATNKELNLELLFFPTNCEGHVFGNWRTGNHNSKLKESEETFEWVCGGKDSKLKKIFIKNENKIKALDITKGKIPARINTSYIYRVHNSNSKYSTDIAAGQITEYFPPKRFTWGTGIIGGGYKTIIFLTSFSHNEDLKLDTKGKLILYVGENKFERSYVLNAESGLEINTNDIVGVNDLNKTKLITWYYVQEKRTKLISYWISYNKNGQITGDHAF